MMYLHLCEQQAPPSHCSAGSLIPFPHREVAVLELVPVLDEDFELEGVPVCEAEFERDLVMVPVWDGRGPDDEGRGPDDEAGIGGEDEAATTPEDEAATTPLDEATTPEDEAATAPEDEAIAPEDELGTTEEALATTEEAFTRTDEFAAPEDKFTLATNEEFIDKFWDEVGGRIDARIDEFIDKFCEEVGGGKELFKAKLSEEVTFCDFTSENMMTWTAKNAKTKRSCFISKI